jgi:DNA polymerase elongation subunit (family B)
MEEADKSILVYDIETYVPHKRPNPEADELRLFTAYSYLSGKFYFLKDVEQIQKIIDKHRFLVGFNTKNYDNPVLKRYGVKLDYKIMVDLYDIIKKRAQAMKVKDGILGDLLMQYSLDYITKTIGLVDETTSKMDIDKKHFMESSWTPEVWDEILIYAKRDVEVTKKLYDWVEEYFTSFKEFVSNKDIHNKSYLTCSTAVFSYKAMALSLGIKEEYDDVQREEVYAGGYVAYPTMEEAHGKIALFDFSSLYPNIFIQCNLFATDCKCCRQEEKWNGDGFFNVKGYYCKKQLSNISKWMKELYMMRMQMKKNKDKREYSCKIILNSSYGAIANPAFKNIYNLIAASDCTSLARQCILYVRKRLREEGYINLAADTDSAFVFIPEGKTLQMLNQLIKDSVSEIQKHMPFSWNEFNMKLEDEITDIFFFKGDKKEIEKDEILDEDDIKAKPLRLMKKNYLYLTHDDKLIYKNLGVKKKSTSALTRKIWKEYLIPKIKAERKVKYSQMYYRNLITELLSKDLSLAALRFEVHDAKTYKLTSQLHAQIAEKYGAGIHFLIPNTRKVGVGIGKSYCTIEEFKYNGLRIEHINLDNVWSELDYFIRPMTVKSLVDY